MHSMQDPVQILEMNQVTLFELNVHMAMYNFIAAVCHLKASYRSFSRSKASHWPLINLKNVNVDFCYEDNSYLGLLLHEAVRI